jgi:flavin-dependent dehydrogenase
MPIGGPIRRSYTDCVLVVGDSAGQVKSTSGGGIYFGLKAAEAAAETAIECLEKNDTSNRYLRRYQTRWRRSIGRELRVTWIMRRILDELTDAEVDRVFQIMSDKTISRIIETHGDTAFQSRLLGPILSKLLRKLIVKPSGTTILAKTLAHGFAGLLS